jgi:hypothetical protein
MKTRLKRNAVGKWWGGKKEYEYDYRKYEDIAKHTGVTISAECQRCKRLYLKFARQVVKEIHPQMPEDEQEQLSWSIMQTDWWEDCIRRAYEER